MSPKVSIIIPTYNRAHILPRALDSVFTQSDKDWEVIIVDDGSTDGTKKCVTGLSDSRIHYAHQVNKGPSAARNHGLTLAKGEWVAYLDSDNVLAPNYLDRMFASITDRTMFAFPKGRQILELWENGQLIEQLDRTDTEFAESVTTQDVFHRKLHTDTNGLMHRRATFIDGIMFDEHIPGMEDWDIILSLSDRYPGGFTYVPEILYTYSQRFGSDGLVGKGDYMFQATVFEYIYQKHKHSKLMQGQQWYPQRVEKWTALHAQYGRGEIPPYHLWYFKERWPSRYKKL